MISSVRVQTTRADGAATSTSPRHRATRSATGATGRRGTDLGTDKTFDTHEATGRYVLIWLTVLPKAGDVYTLQITEVTVA